MIEGYTKIETIKDILELVNEDNLEYFLTDFNRWLRIVIPIKENLFTQGTFWWKDDKENNIEIQIAHKETES